MPRILIVDDDAAQRFLIDLILRRAGYESMGAQSAVHALDLLRTDSAFDLIMTDIRMPVMDGVNFLKEIRVRYSHIPVIVMTVHGESNWLNEAKEIGAVACLTKPFIAPQVTETLQAIGLMPGVRAVRQPTY